MTGWVTDENFWKELLRLYTPVADLTCTRVQRPKAAKTLVKLKPPMFPPGRSVTQNLQNYYRSDFKICLLAKETALDIFANVIGNDG